MTSPYVYERQVEYWTSREIEGFFLNFRYAGRYSWVRTSFYRIEGEYAGEGITEILRVQ